MPLASIFVVMTMLSIPRSLLWLATGALITMLLMMLYRLITITLFAPVFTPSSMGEVIFLGTRYDLRYTALFILPVFLFSLVKPLHPFKTRNGRSAALWLLTLTAFMMFFIYGCDLAYQISFRKRLTTSIIKDILNSTEKGQQFTSNAPWVIIFLITGIGSWLYYLLMKYMHQVLAHSRQQRSNFLRNFWQIVTAVLIIGAIYGRPFPPPLTGKRAKDLGNNEAYQAALNPFESIRIYRNSKK